MELNKLTLITVYHKNKEVKSPVKSILNNLKTLIVAITLVACEDYEHSNINKAFALVNNNPDSALTILNKVDLSHLSEHDMAFYAITYTIAQDKNGQDVANDSLLRYAINWYPSHTDDSLYAKYSYYVGKYYALNDSIDKAIANYDQAIRLAEEIHDTLIQCLALNRASAILRKYDSSKSVKYANDAMHLYNKMQNANESNKSYFLIDLAIAHFFNEDNPEIALRLSKKAQLHALKSKNSRTISDVLQFMSVLYNNLELNDSSLLYAKESFHHSKTDNIIPLLTLSMAYTMTDSLEQAKNILNSIPKSKYKGFEDKIFFRYREISMHENNLKDAVAYSDSIHLFYLNKASKDSRMRDAYYSQLIDKETERMEIINHNKRNWLIACNCIAILILLISFFAYMRWTRIQDEKRMLLIASKNKEMQLSTMRNYLIKNVGLKATIQHLQSNNDPKLEQQDWDEIEQFLKNTDSEFIERLCREFPSLTKKDLHFLMLIRLKLSTSTIASIYCIEEKSVKQKLFLIKTKLGLKNSSISARNFIEKY